MRQEVRVAREGLWIFLMLVFSVGQVLFFHSALESQAVHSARIITRMMDQLLAHTHRLNDDLTMQMAIQGLSQSPGVLFACVLDNDKKIVAHTDPTLLGHPFNANLNRSRHQSLWVHSLKDVSTPWGTLVFALSQRSLSQKFVQEAGLLIAGDVALALSVLWLWMYWKQIHTQELDRGEDLARQRSELADQMTELIQKQKQSEVLSMAWIQRAVEQIPEAVMLLDPTQRVLAANKSREDLRGQSWQDVTELKECGDALQHSIETPGEKIEVRISGDTGALQFLSQVTPEGNLIGTWVFFR